MARPFHDIAWLRLLLLPSLSLVYATIVAFFLYGWGENSLGRLLRPCLPHVTLWLLVVAHYIQLQTSEADSETISTASLLVTAAANVAALYLLRYTRQHQVVGGSAPSLASKNVMGGKVVLITGANAGIGKETALQLLQMGASTIIMACRSMERAQAAKDEILLALRQKQDDDPAIDTEDGRILLLQLDLSSCCGVRQAAATVRRTMPKIDVLVNNAGVMMGQQVWTDGDEEEHELVMQANHLGHFLFTMLLLDHLAADDARILNVTSSTYTLMDGVDMLDDLFCANKNEKGRPYTLFGQYAASKLANILFTHSLRRFQHSSNTNFTAHAVHPGLVRTDVTRNMPWVLRIGNRLFSILIQTLQKTPPQGAWCTVAVASMPREQLRDLERQVQSCYWVNQKPQKLRPFAQDEKLMERLWKKSCELVGLHESGKSK